MDAWVVSQHRAIFMEQDDGGVFSERQRSEEVFEAGDLDTPPNDPHEFATAACQPAGEDSCPSARDAALDQFDQCGR